jgi:transcriptional regulator with XRE-family HTH domain
MTGAELRAIRKARSWTQERLASLTGYTRSYFAQMERGEVPVPPRMERQVPMLEQQCIIIGAAHKMSVLLGLVQDPATVALPQPNETPATKRATMHKRAARQPITLEDMGSEEYRAALRRYIWTGEGKEELDRLRAG